MSRGDALGLIETKGFTGLIEALDACLKTANVKLRGVEKVVGGAYCVIMLEGDIGAVKAAVSAGITAAQKVGDLISGHVITRVLDEENPMLDLMGHVKEYGLEENAVKKEIIKNVEYTCNHCKNIECPRKKGEPLVNCIHFNKK